MQVVSNYVLLESKVKEFSSKVNLLFSRATEREGLAARTADAIGLYANMDITQ